jgi:hypothetical protein
MQQIRTMRGTTGAGRSDAQGAPKSPGNTIRFDTPVF